MCYRDLDLGFIVSLCVKKKNVDMQNQWNYYKVLTIEMLF